VNCNVCRDTGVVDNNGDMYDYEERPCDECTPAELLEFIERLTSERDALQDELAKRSK